MTHRPTPDQLEDLHQRGYEIVHISAQVQAHTALRMWQYILECCGDVDLIIAVMPALKLTKLAHVADVPVLTARMQREIKDDGQAVYHWSGNWRRVVGVSIRTEPWDGN
jgi:hypothetical protein